LPCAWKASDLKATAQARHLAAPANRRAILLRAGLRLGNRISTEYSSIPEEEESWLGLHW
jgi:hypothetical protein